MKASFNAHGKLLISAEYFVLDGAKALALPLQPGQSLRVTSHRTVENSPVLNWESMDENGEKWFWSTFHLNTLEIKDCSDIPTASKLWEILSRCKKTNTEFLKPPGNYPSGTESFRASTRLSFPREWGLGSSSTLISLLAQWADVNPFQLQFETFGGSGYDVACATANGPIIYQLNDTNPNIQECSFNPPFRENLYFVYLGRKQNSREGITQFRQKAQTTKTQIEIVSELTLKMSESTTLSEFEGLILQHEELVSKAIGMPKVKQTHFSSYWGQIKSLGAWGGDFVLATSHHSESRTKRYFNEKGFDVFLPFRELVL